MSETLAYRWRYYRPVARAASGRSRQLDHFLAAVLYRPQRSARQFTIDSWTKLNLHITDGPSLAAEAIDKMVKTK
jgi:hypothetical protein